MDLCFFPPSTALTLGSPHSTKISSVWCLTCMWVLLKSFCVQWWYGTFDWLFETYFNLNFIRQTSWSQSFWRADGHKRLTALTIRKHTRLPVLQDPVELLTELLVARVTEKIIPPALGMKMLQTNKKKYNYKKRKKLSHSLTQIMVSVLIIKWSSLLFRMWTAKCYNHWTQICSCWKF